MSEQVERLTRVSVFGGASGGCPAREGLREFLRVWEVEGWGGMDRLSRVDDLDAMWLAADIGRFLAKHKKWQLVTGGYDMGTMGMGSRSAAIFGRRYGTNISPVGVPLPDYFPNDPHTAGEISGARNLPDRLEKLTGVDAIIVLRGAHGTLNELTTAIEEEDLRDETERAGVLTLKPRPIIIADPTGRMSGLLQYIFGKYVPKFYQQKGPNVIDRIYLLDEGCFLVNREHPLSATVRLSQRGEEQLEAVLEAYTESGETTAQRDRQITVPTLREYLQIQDKV